MRKGTKKPTRTRTRRTLGPLPVYPPGKPLPVSITRNAEKNLKKKAKFEVFEGLIRNLDKNWVWRMRGANFG